MTNPGRYPARGRSPLPTILGVAAIGTVFMLILACGGLTLIGATIRTPARSVALQSRAPGATVPVAPAATPSSALTDGAAPAPSPTASPSPTAPATAAVPPAPAATPAAPATKAPAPATKAPSTCGAPANPFGFTFCGGAHIYAADLPPGVCDYFACIANFFNGVGYMEECKDGTYSMSGGRQGACSKHGGEARAVYRA